MLFVYNIKNKIIRKNFSKNSLSLKKKFHENSLIFPGAKKNPWKFQDFQGIDILFDTEEFQTLI